MYSRIGVSVQAQEVNLRLGSACRIACLRRLQCALTVQCQSRPVRILISIEKDIRPVVFVVTGS